MAVVSKSNNGSWYGGDAASWGRNSCTCNWKSWPSLGLSLRNSSMADGCGAGSGVGRGKGRLSKRVGVYLVEGFGEECGCGLEVCEHFFAGTKCRSARHYMCRINCDATLTS